MVNTLNIFLYEIRDSRNRIEQIKDRAINICENKSLKSEFKIKRKYKKLSGENCLHEDIFINQWLTLEYYKVLDNLMAQMKWKLKKLSSISNDF